MPVDGVHDLGGMQGFGPVEMETNEPVFHADWERHAYRLTISSMLAGHLNGRFRHAIERMDPAWYLASPYYEHWLTATATGLVEGGLITQEELDDRLGAPYPVARPVRGSTTRRSGSFGGGPPLRGRRGGAGARVASARPYPSPPLCPRQARHRRPPRRRVLTPRRGVSLRSSTQ